VKLVFLAFVAFCAVARADIDPALQEPGVLYLQGNVPDKVMATIKAPTSLYSEHNFQMVLAVLNPGQKVEILGSSPDGYLIKGMARGNSVSGWIHPQDLPTGFDPTIFAVAQKTQDRRNEVAVAISNKKVIPGMTPDEVEQAVGHPDETSSRTTANGSSETWTFTTYREEPQYSYALDGFGRAVLQTYYVKIPIGQMTVSFAKGVVATIDQHKTDPNSPGVVTN
jgi:hypothetical protein